MKHNCLYCYNELNGEIDFHQKCSIEFFGSKIAPQLPYTYNQMTDLAKEVIDRRVSVPGVQAKLSMSVVNKALKKDNRLTVVDALGGNYIFKPPNNKFPEIPQNEHATMRMAEAIGIKVVPSSLIKLQSGELSYITKRIDRTDDGSKIHMLDMFQLTEAFDKYKSSMEKIGKVIDMYSANTALDKLYFLELSLFSFLTGNNDMHLKNFSLIVTDYGWILSPAYDLLNVTILNPDNKEEMVLPIEGKKKKLQRKHFEQLGNSLGLTLKQISGVFNRFYVKKEVVIMVLNSSFLSSEMKSKYLQILNERYDTIYL